MNISTSKIAVFLLFLTLSTTAIKVANKHTSPTRVEANTNVLKGTFNSSQVVSGSAYQSYENEEWLLTAGGNNNGVGVLNFPTNLSLMELGVHTNLVAFDQTIGANTRYISAAISKQAVANVSSVTLSIMGTSYYNYLDVTTYLVASTSLEGDYYLVKEIKQLTTTSGSYEFDKIEQAMFYAFVFYNPQGVFLLSSVSASLYGTIDTYNKVDIATSLNFGATYVLIDETSSNALEVIDSQISQTNINIDNNSFSALDITKFTLLIGSQINTYIFKLSEEELYLNIDNYNKLTLNHEPRDFSISFTPSFLISDHMSALHLAFDQVNEQFYLSPSGGLSLYRLEQALDYQLETNLFVEQVLVTGENIKGQCLEVYDFFDSVYQRLSPQAKAYFLSSDDELITGARIRIDYLSSWSSANSVNSAQTLKINQKNINILIIFITLSVIPVISYIVHSNKERA